MIPKNNFVRLGRRCLPWLILGLFPVLGLWAVCRSYQNFTITRDWFEGRNSARLTGMMLRIAESSVYARNTNLLFGIDSELPKKAFSPSLGSGIFDARLELDGVWRGWVVMSCNYDEGTLTIGVPEKLSIFPVEFDYAKLRMGKTNMYDLRNVLDGARQMAE